MEELLKDTFGDIFENFIIDFSLVLYCLLFVVFYTNLKDAHALGGKVRDGRRTTCFLQGCDAGADENQSFFFDFVAAVLSYHFTLIGKV